MLGRIDTNVSLFRTQNQRVDSEEVMRVGLDESSREVGGGGSKTRSCSVHGGENNKNQKTKEEKKKNHKRNKKKTKKNQTPHTQHKQKGLLSLIAERGSGRGGVKRCIVRALRPILKKNNLMRRNKTKEEVERETCSQQTW